MDLHELGLRLWKATGELDVCLEPPAKMFAFSPLLKVDATLDLLHYWKWTKKNEAVSVGGANIWPSAVSPPPCLLLPLRHSPLFLSVCVLFLQESDGIP